MYVCGCALPVVLLACSRNGGVPHARGGALHMKTRAPCACMPELCAPAVGAVPTGARLFLGHGVAMRPSCACRLCSQRMRGSSRRCRCPVCVCVCVCVRVRACVRVCFHPRARASCVPASQARVRAASYQLPRQRTLAMDLLAWHCPGLPISACFQKARANRTGLQSGPRLHSTQPGACCCCCCCC
jgi:hypothetical protein